MTSKVWCRLPLAVLLGLALVVYAAAQSGKSDRVTPEAKTPQGAPWLVEENPYFRVFRGELAPGVQNKIDQHGSDLVVLALGSGLGLTARGSAAADSLKDGEPRFVPQQSDPAIINTGNGLPQFLLVELKHHWDTEVRACSEPSKCTRPIRMGDASIGETTSLFTNGFITAYRHRLDTGGTLSSSYFSSKGTDHLLLIALTDLRANFDGAEETLQSGQTYASEARTVEVDAAKAEARWVVIRMQTPKP